MMTGEVASAVAAPMEWRSSVERYLISRLGRSLRVTEVKHIFPGVSRETWIIDARVDDRPEGFVLRLDPPWGACAPTSLEYEFRVYEKLWQSAIPVAEPLWFDQHTDFAEGRPHMIRRLVKGSSTIPGITAATPEGEQLRRQVVLNHMETLAALHRLDWRAMGFDAFMPVPPSPAEALRFDFEQWRARWNERRTEPRPVVTEFLCWIEENLPDDTPTVSLIKGNNGVGEEIFSDGRLVALSDFELAALGDGALDLAFTQGTLSLIDPRDAIAHYEQHVGHPVSAERFAFAIVWNTFKGLVMLDGWLARGFIDGIDPRPTSGALGLVMVRQLERTLGSFIGRNLVAAARDVAEAAAGQYLDV